MTILLDLLKSLVTEEGSFFEDSKVVEGIDCDVQLLIKGCTISFDRDRIGLLLSDAEFGESERQDVALWAAFLDADTIELSVDEDGWVLTKDKEQFRFVLTLTQRIIEEIFLDPEQFELAQQFVRGYTYAYNEWASGEWEDA